MSLLLPHPLADFLRTGQLVRAVERAQAWLPSASYESLLLLLDSCPRYLQPRLTELLRDVLAGYPAALYACPVVMRFEPADHSKYLRLTLPDQPPGDDISSLAWLSWRSMSDSARPAFVAGVEPIWIEPYILDGATLLLRTKGAGAPQMPPDSWFSELFEIHAGDRFYMSAPQIVPLLECHEALARLLTSARGGHLADTPRRFVHLDAYQLADDAGRRFRAMLASR